MASSSHAPLSKKLPLISKLQRHGRVYILPTRHGLAFLVALFFLFLLALTYGHSLAFAAAFFLTSLLMSSALLTNQNLKGLDIIEVDSPKVLRLGEFEDFRYLIKNDSQSSRFDLCLESWGDEKLNAHVLKEAQAQQTSWGRSSFQFTKRGLYQARRLSLSTTYPFGLFRAWITFPINLTVAIAPRALEHHSLLETRLAMPEQDQEFGSSEMGSGDEFYQHSLMLEHDSWRRVDWKAWAKKDLFLRKNFEAQSREILCYQQNDSGVLTLHQQYEQMSWWLKKQELTNEVFIFEMTSPEYFRVGPTQGREAVEAILVKLAVLP